MIGKLKGVVDEKTSDSLLMDVGGVCYRVACAASVLDEAQQGEAKTLWIETRMNDYGLTLYGFSSPAQLEWFKRMTAVPGVGVKATLSLLSLGVGALEELILAGDSAALSKAPGIGQKLAARLVGELKDKLPPALGHRGGKVIPLHASVDKSALSALVNLGYTESVARQTVLRVLSAHENLPLEETIKTCLQELAR